MGKTGSTAIARAVQDATGAPRVPGVPPRSRPARARPSSATARAASARRRRRAAVRVPRRAAPLGVGVPAAAPADRRPRRGRVITTVREPIAQAVSAFFHGSGRRGLLADGPSRRRARRRRLLAERLAPRARCAGSTGSSRPRSGSTCSSSPSTPPSGTRVIDTPAVAGAAAPPGEPRRRARRRSPRSSGSPRSGAGPAPQRGQRQGVRRPATGSSSSRCGSPIRCSTRCTSSRYARHFYADSEWERFRRRWAEGPEPTRIALTPRTIRTPRSGWPSGLVTISAEEGAGMDDSDKGDASGASGGDAAAGADRPSAAWSGTPARSRPTPRSSSSSASAVGTAFVGGARQDRLCCGPAPPPASSAPARGRASSSSSARSS